MGNCYDPGTGNGQYSSLALCQSNCIIPSWDCDGLGNCYDPGTGNGLYSSLSNCELECVNVVIDEYRELIFNIYPNPTNSECVINSNKNIQKLRIFDISARLCISKDFDSNTVILDVRTLSPGVYTVELITDEESIKRQLIIH